MKLKIFMGSLAMAFMLTGCASSYKLTMPKGRWQAVNQAGFIPAKAERYYVDDLKTNQPKALEPKVVQVDSEIIESIQ